MSTVQLYPVLPLWLLGVLIACTLWLLWRFSRNSSVSPSWRLLLWALRAGTVLILAWLLLLAERRVERTEMEPPTLAVAIDVSASMTKQLGDNPRSRAGNALRFLESAEFAGGSGKYRLAVFSIGEDLEETDEEWSRLRFNRARSNISQSLNQMANRLRNENLAGAILLSDGLDHSGTEAGARLMQQPLFVPELESWFEPETETVEDEVYMAELSHPPRLVKGWQAHVEVLVRRRGSGSLNVTLHAFRDGDEWQTESLQFAEGEFFKRVRLPVKPDRVGALHLTLDLDLPPGVSSRRPTRELMIEVMAGRGRILYLEGVPRWEFRFLREVLREDDKLAVTAMVRGADGLFVAFGESEEEDAPVDLERLPDRLEDYGLIILGDLPDTALPPASLAGLQRFVEGGGGLLLLAGSQALGDHGLLAMPELAAMSPVRRQPGARIETGRFQAIMDGAARTHPALRDLPASLMFPPVNTLWQPMELHDLATPLVATPAGDPMVAARRYGGGRVILVLSDSLWRWQLAQDAPTVEGKSLYSALVNRLVQWLLPTEDELPEAGILQVTTAQRQYELRQEVLVGASLGQVESLPAELSCVVTGPDQEWRLPMTQARLGAEVGLRQEQPGFRARFMPEQPGIYQIRTNLPDASQAAATEILVVVPERELTGQPINREYLQRMAADSGGQFVSLSNWHEIWDALPYQPVMTTAVAEYTIWDHWLWLLLLTALLGCQWWLRRKLGLL